MVNLRFELVKQFYNRGETLEGNFAFITQIENFINQSAEKPKEKEVASDKRANSKNGGKSNN